MTENLKYAIVLPLSAYLLSTAILHACSMESEGIHPIGSDAVYIAGEACTVNMTLDRSEEEIATDMEICLALHKGYSHE